MQFPILSFSWEGEPQVPGGAEIQCKKQTKQKILIIILDKQGLPRSLYCGGREEERITKGAVKFCLPFSRYFQILGLHPVGGLKDAEWL